PPGRRMRQARPGGARSNGPGDPRAPAWRVREGDHCHLQPGQPAVRRACGLSVPGRNHPAADPGELATPPARPIAGRPIMHEHRGQTSSRRIRARRRRLTLAWLAMLVLLAVAAAVVVIAAYRVRTCG